MINHSAKFIQAFDPYKGETPVFEVKIPGRNSYLTFPFSFCNAILFYHKVHKVGHRGHKENLVSFFSLSPQLPLRFSLLKQSD